MPLGVPGAYKAFWYRVTHLLEFRQGDYQEKDIRFTYNKQEYHFRINLNRR
ncbi:MAG TPA: hypothetical protein VGB46_08850 [Flavisolibacter sp.]